MNFIALETARKLRGGYYTPPDLSAFLARWILDGRSARILEPACGDGGFFDALGGLDHTGVQAIVGCELDPGEAQKARVRGRPLQPAAVTVHAADFLHWAQPRLAGPPAFDAALLARQDERLLRPMRMTKGIASYSCTPGGACPTDATAQ